MVCRIEGIKMAMGNKPRQRPKTQKTTGSSGIGSFVYKPLESSYDGGGGVFI